MPKLTEETLARRRRRLKKNAIKHDGDMTVAYMETYPKCKRSSASSAVSQLLKNEPEVRQSIVESLNEAGISVRRLNKKLSGKLDATKTISTPTGEIITVEDNATQMDAMKIGYKLHGHLQSGGNVSIDNRSVSMTQIDPTKLEQITKDMQAMHNQLKEDNGRQTGDV